MAKLKYFILLFFSIIIINNLKCQEKGNITNGKKIFHERKNSDNKTCVECHNVDYIKSDTILPYPSAWDLNVYSTSLSIEEFQKRVNKPDGKLFTKVHSNYSISKEETSDLISYIQTVSNPIDSRPIPIDSNLILIIIFIGIGLVFQVDMIFTRFIKARIVHVVVLLICGYMILTTLYTGGASIGRQEGYAPDQPIKFSHKIHATDNKIKCIYCHSGANYSKNAGIPSVGLCMNCHKHVLEGPKTGKFEINKIHYAVNNNKAIEWTKVHNLPDHVFFNHSQHVKVGKLDCVKCHGDVEGMSILKQQESLSMKWCLDCHNETKVDITDPYYQHTFRSLAHKILTNQLDSVTVSDLGGKDCSKCHY